MYMAVVVSIISGYGISLHMCRGNYPNMAKLALYKLLLDCNNHLKQL